LARVLDEDELIGNWTLVGDELKLLSGRRGATKLGVALLLRFYAVHGRFPVGRGELPDQAGEYVARLVKVPAAELASYAWDAGRSRITAPTSGLFRVPGVLSAGCGQGGRLAGRECVTKERQTDRVRETLLAHLRAERIEPPTRERVRRLGDPAG
jgi:hypothetical protein